MSQSGRPNPAAFSAFVTLVLFVEVLSPFSFAQSFSTSGEPAVADAATQQKVASFASEIAAAKAASFASTATPTPTAGAAASSSSTVAQSGACTVSKQNGSEVKLIWDSTLGFVGNEINSLNDSALKSSDSTAFTNATSGGQVVINNYINTGTSTSATARVPVADVARLLGKSTSEVANDFAVDPVNGTISMQMFQAEAEKNSALSGYLSQFSSLLGSSALSSVETPAYTNYKVKLPNGKTLSLSDVYALQDLNGETDACLLDNSFIQGRVSYAGQLDRDIYLGFDRSSSTTSSNQHLTSSNTVAAFSLNKGSSIVVPLRYQRFLGAVKQVLMADTLLSLAETGYMWVQKDNIVDQISDQTELAERNRVLLDQGTAINPMTWSNIVNDPQKFRVYSVISTTNPNPKEMLSLLSDVDKEIVAAKAAGVSTSLLDTQRTVLYNTLSESAVASKLESQLGVKIADTVWSDPSAYANPARTVTGTFDSTLETSLGSALKGKTKDVASAFGMGDSQSIRMIDNQIELDKISAQRVDKLALTSERNKLDKVFQLVQSKAMNNFLMGFLWLGYGRFGLSVATGMTFQSSSKVLADNYLQVMVNRNDVLKEFRDSTSWALNGVVLEQVANFLGSGVPREAFGVGPMIFINSPYETATEKGSTDAVTNLQYTGTSWQVSSSWDGKSDATLFEDVRDEPKYARMPMYVSNMTLGANLNKNEFGADYYTALATLAPVFAWKLLKSPNEVFIPIARIMTLDIYISNFIDPMSYSSKDVCKDSEVNSRITAYALATTASQASNVLQMGMVTGGESIFKSQYLRLLSGRSDLKPWNDYFKGLLTVSSYISPFDMIKAYVAGDGFTYTQTCKDTGYSVVGYQELDSKPKSSLASLAQKLNPLQSSSVIGNLSFGSALQGVGSALTTEAMSEIINTKLTMENQAGMVRPSELYYLHLDGASEVSAGIYSALEAGGCFRKCEDGTTMAVCETDSGTYIIDKATGAKTQISDRDRALLSILMQDIAKTLIPNTLISAQLACGSDSVIMQAGTDAHVIGSSGCATTECLMTQLAALSGSTLSGGDISSVMGEVSAVKTSTGLALFESGKPIRFIYTAGTTTKTKSVSVLAPGYLDINGIAVNENDTAVTESDKQSGYVTETVSKVGTEVSSPSIDAVAAAENGTMTTADAYDSALLNIHGDASVTLSGFTSGTDYGEVDVGELQSIIFKRGRIEYDSANNRLVAALYILGEADFAKSVKGVSVAATKNANENGTDNAIKINLTAKGGMEDTVSELNKALATVQGSGGMQMLETNNTIYYFTKNAAGEDVLKICDKATSTCKEYRITGALSSDGSTITVPTESGIFRIGFGTNAATGYPEINVTGPNGYAELATLLAAKGQNGIFVFDPLTGLAKILNGQDLSLSSDFASKGMSFYGTSTGTTGVAGSNYVGLARTTGTSSSSSSPFSVPSVPVDNTPVAVLMLLALLGTVAAVRAYKE
ncbi:MAG: hypothetical protein WCX64_03110 [Candidatus Micrarchaeia archaeon]